ncbi:hypothetical protein FGB62_104g037 [Gracilaria domingensis]|nr:hypothetical protein FGB62_104g037 [Gracilaria domingensis]
MFFSKFKEASERTVALSVSSSVLHHVLVYVYTGHCPLVKRMLTRIMAEEYCDDDFKLLVDIKEAADCYNMGKLFRWCRSTLIQIASEFPELACNIVQCMSVHGLHDETRDEILDFIRENYQDAFNIPQRLFSDIDDEEDENNNLQGILKLSAETLNDVLDGDLSEFDSHEDLFESIYFWVTNGRLLTGKRCRLRPEGPCQSSHAAAKSDKDTATSEENDSRESDLDESSDSDDGSDSDDNSSSDKSSDDEESSDSECSDCEDSDDQESFMYVNQDRLEWSKKFVGRLNLKSMRIRYVHDFVIPTGLLENVDLMDVLWNYVLSTTNAIELHWTTKKLSRSSGSRKPKKKRSSSKKAALYRWV